jgi:tRNA-2-methylthio-N6-dimethylallyladenosine synthase
MNTAVPANKKDPKYFVITYGCQQNRAESERIAGAYEGRGFTPAATAEEADAVVVNTCMVRQQAEDRVYGLMKNLAPAKQANPHMRITITGCLAGAALRDPSGVMLKTMQRRLPLADEFLLIDEVGYDVPAKRADSEHGLVVISNGCNNFCTYCIVPYTRGREVSRPYAEIVTEVEELAAKGYTKITLLGQNVNSWGSDIVSPPKDSIRTARADWMEEAREVESRESIAGRQFEIEPDRFVDPVMVPLSMGKTRVPTLFPYLLERVAQVPGIEQVSFLSSNPWDFSDALISVMARNPNIDRYIHLPVQSGSDTVLKRMNRQYTRQSYLDLVCRIRQVIPEAEIGTDLIVGFPGESDEQFEETVSLCRQAQFVVAFIGMYSVRPGTAAAKALKDDVDDAEKHRRFHILDDLVNHKAKKPYAVSRTPAYHS